MVTNKNSNRKRITPQRQVILNYLKKADCHPTAKEVHTAVEEDLPRISLGTVYRNLKELVEEGKIQKIAGEEVRYDWNNSSHGHFICKECEEVYDISLNCEDLIEKVQVGEVETCQVYFYGICEDCKDN
ncbi:MAG: transcriptional repressor [Candidatus Paceibacterota bacterium]